MAWPVLNGILNLTVAEESTTNNIPYYLSYYM